MNKRFCTIFTGLALLLAAGCAAMGVVMAEEKGKTGFDLSLHHIGISVADLDESIAWYREMLGFEEIMRMDQGATIKEMKIGHIRRGNCYIELFEVAGSKPLPEYRRDPNADLAVQGLKHFGLQVNSVKAAIAELKAKGVEVAMEPIDTPGVAFVFIRDNSGNAFELIEFKDRKAGSASQ
ncbi:MAG: VOC family protein [Acidobacteria bacterium]|nr:VOC family protein [Acidobacteriota bacterium]